MVSSFLPRLGLHIALSCALSSVAPVFCQAPTQAPTPAPTPAPGGNTGGGTPAPGGGTRPGQQPQQQQPFPSREQNPFEMQRPVFLSGKVILDDGTPPPQGVQIERICGSVVRGEGYTDSKGRFSFQLGQNQHIMADASQSSVGDMTSMGRSSMGGGMSGGISERDLNGCELRANLPGFRSDVINIVGRRAMDNPEVGSIVLHRLAKVEGLTFSGTTLFAPKDAKKAYEKGLQASKKKKWDEAEQSLRKAVDEYPKFAEAWYQLGAVYQQQGKAAEARESYLTSVKTDEKYVTPYAQLARMAAAEQKWPDVLDLSAKVIKLNPYFSHDIYYISAVANFNMRNMEAAEEQAREALKLDPQHRNPRINHLLGVVLAQKESYPEAAENMRAFLKRVPEGPDAENVKKQLLQVERMIGGTVQSAQ